MTHRGEPMTDTSSPTVRPPSRPVHYTSLPLRPIRQFKTADEWPPLWWVGCHGGAGTTTLAALTGLGVDGGTAWPTPEPGQPPVRVVLVCRASAAGAQAATAAVEQRKRQAALAEIHLLGVVAVAASARKPPRRAAERLRLLAGWAPAVWRVGWVEEYLAADDPGELGVQPDVAALQHAVDRLLASQ